MSETLTRKVENQHEQFYKSDQNIISGEKKGKGIFLGNKNMLLRYLEKK